VEFSIAVFVAYLIVSFIIIPFTFVVVASSLAMTFILSSDRSWVPDEFSISAPFSTWMLVGELFSFR